MLRIIESESFRVLSARTARRSYSVIAVALLASMALSSTVNASAISYGSLPGATVVYTNIQENSATDPGLFPPNLPGTGLFGTPVVTGDALNFTPLNFFARNNNAAAPGFDTTDGHLIFGVDANSGKTITNINFKEGGAYSVAGIGGVNTLVDVSAVGFVDVLEVDGSAPGGLIQIPINMTFDFGPAGNGTWTRADGFANAKLWTGGQLVDIAGYLHTNGYPNAVGATLVSVELDNSLYAQSEAASGAFIDKKDFGGLSVTVNAPMIPEPGTWLLALVGCLMAAGKRRAGR